jgi:hypothetical protein
MLAMQNRSGAQSDSQQIFSSTWAKNTPERKNYIMENLVVTVEE